MQISFLYYAAGRFFAPSDCREHFPKYTPYCSISCTYTVDFFATFDRKLFAENILSTISFLEEHYLIFYATFSITTFLNLQETGVKYVRLLLNFTCILILQDGFRIRLEGEHGLSVLQLLRLNGESNEECL